MRQLIACMIAAIVGALGLLFIAVCYALPCVIILLAIKYLFF